MLSLVLIGLLGFSAQEVPTGSDRFDDVLRIQSIDDVSGAYLDDYLAHWEFGEPALSPSGRYLAFLHRTNVSDRNSVRVIVQDLEAEEEGAYSVGSFRNGRPVWVRWASDDRVLVGTEQRLDISINQRMRGYPTLERRTHAFDRDFTNHVMLFQEAGRRVLERNADLSSVIDIMPRDRDHVLVQAFLSGRLGLWRANIYTGEAELAERGRNGTIGWHASNGQAALRFDTNYRFSRVQVFARNAGGRWRHALTVRPRDLPEISHDFNWAGQSAAANEVYVRARQDGQEFAGIHRFDLETGTYLETLAVRDDFDIEDAVLDPVTGLYMGYSYVADRRLFRFEDAELDAHYQAILEYFGDGMSVRPLSRQGSKLLLHVTGPTELGAYHLYDLETANVDLLFSRSPQISGERFHTVESISYTSRDGVEIPALLTWPPQGPGPDTPLIVMPHGGPEARDSVSHDGMTQMFANLGYAVLQPNFRGSSGYGRSYVELGHGEWGRAMQTDLDDGARWLLEENQIDADRICVVGFSYGGYAALMAAVEQSDFYACVVAGAPVTDIASFLEYKGEISDDVFDYWTEQLGDPEAPGIPAHQRQISPAFQADRIEIPVMLFHGDADWQVPVEQSRLMAEALDSAEVEFVYVERDGLGHNWGTARGRVRANMTAVRAFLDEVFFGERAYRQRAGFVPER